MFFYIVRSEREREMVRKYDHVDSRSHRGQQKIYRDIYKYIEYILRSLGGDEKTAEERRV